MFKSLGTLRQAEKDLVIGYYRLNYNEYFAMEIMQISMLYLWILEEFDISRESNNIRIKGKNKTICCAVNNSYGSVFGRNTISTSKSDELANYYHWRLKIVRRSESNDNEKNGNFIIGIMKQSETQKCGDLSFVTVHGIKQTSYAFIGSHSRTINGTMNYSTDWDRQKFRNKNDIVDMYYDGNKGELSFVVNNHDCGVAFDDIDTSMNYRMALSLHGKKTSLRLLSYHHSASYPFKKINNSSNIVGFGRCLYDIDDKMKYYLMGMAQKNEILSEWHNDYIDCLCIKGKYDECGEYIIQNKLKRINVIHNIGHIISPLFENEQYFEVVSVLKCIEEQMIKNEDLTFYFYSKISTSYFWINDYKESIKYYDLCLIHIDDQFIKKKLSKTEYDLAEESLCHVLFIINFEEKQYEKALSYISRLGDERIFKYNLQIKVAQSYKQTKDYKNAIKFYNKLISINPEEYKYLLIIADLYKSMGNMKECKKYREKAFELGDDAYVYMEFAEYLQAENNMNDAILYYKKAAKYHTDNEMKSECFTIIGGLYGQINNLLDAVEAYKKAIEFNPTNTRALNNISYDYMGLNEYEFAYKYLKIALDIDTNRYLANGNMGNVLCKMERFDEAIPYLLKSISSDRDLSHPDVGPLCLLNYAKILNMKQDYKQSIVVCQQLIDRIDKDENENIHNVNKHEIYYLMANNLQKQSKLNESMKYAQKALELHSENDVYRQFVQHIQHEINKLSL